MFETVPDAPWIKEAMRDGGFPNDLEEVPSMLCASRRFLTKYEDFLSRYVKRLQKEVFTMTEKEIRFWIRRHRRFWWWLSQNPKKTKIDHPFWSWNGGPCSEAVANHSECFLCYLTDTLDTGCCVLDWPSGHCMSHKPTGLFSLWINAQIKEDWEECRALAKQIAQLPIASKFKKEFLLSQSNKV